MLFIAQLIYSYETMYYQSFFFHNIFKNKGKRNLEENIRKNEKIKN